MRAAISAGIVTVRRSMAGMMSSVILSNLTLSHCPRHAASGPLPTPLVNDNVLFMLKMKVAMAAAPGGGARPASHRRGGGQARCGAGLGLWNLQRGGGEVGDSTI